MNMLFNSLKANNRPYMMPLRKWILLVIRWAGVGYGLYLVEELIHGEATPCMTFPRLDIICRLREKTKSRCSRRDSRVLEIFTLFSFYLFYHKKLQNFKIQQPLHQNKPHFAPKLQLTSHKTVILLIIQASTQLILTIYLSNQMLFCLFMSIQEDNYQPKVSLW